jgi:catechol 2,3-dioxygenase-like lactoylglutathione lyase family enzyme
MKLLNAIPALPVRHIARSVEFYRDKLGFALRHEEDAFAILGRDAVELHLWAAADERWRARAGPSPVVSGAESFIAGTASCRVAVVGVEELHRSLEPLGIVHPNAHLATKPWGTREFAVLDLDRNLITFFEPDEPRRT